MVEKKGYAVQMNFNVPESEKDTAQQARDQLEALLKSFEDVSSYLDLIYGPFQKHQNVDMEMVAKYRKTFREYSDNVKKKLDEAIETAFYAISLMSQFSTDTATEELMESLIGSIRELEKYIDIFVSIFSNLDSPEFRNHLIATIDSIKKQMNQTKQLVSDRILNHIDSNILAKDWASDLSERLDDPIQERVPLVVQLFRERQKALQDSGK